MSPSAAPAKAINSLAFAVVMGAAASAVVVFESVWVVMLVAY
ncbi:hypothetical protein [Duffyella gerundensis]|jgi:hypothetical protein|nr:hypothetical protein [Duffyella gerundensis]